MLASLGATERNVRLALIANGVVVGIVGAVVGTVLGLSAWLAYAPRLEVSAHHKFSAENVPWWLIAATAVAAVAVAGFASRRPARTFGELLVMASLAGRPLPPKEGRHAVRTGFAVLAGGIIALGLATNSQGTINSAPLVLAGLIGVIIGMVLVAPVCVGWFATAGDRAPVAIRIALRDLRRYRARSGVALAASSLAIMIAITVSVLATARYTDVIDYVGPNLPANQLVVYGPDNSPGGTRLVISPAGVAKLPGPPPDLLLQAGDFLAANPTFRSIPDPKIQYSSSLPAYVSDPNLMITSYGAARLGLKMAPTAWLIQAAQPFSAAQINTARQLAAAAGITIDARNQIPSLDQVRNDATIVGILLALAVLAMTVGLIRSETAGDLRTLTATGASGRTRRTITAATTGALALLAAVIGTVVAYLVTAALYRAHLLAVLTQIPLLDLGLVLLALPAAATAGGWLFAGREPPAIARQPIG